MTHIELSLSPLPQSSLEIGMTDCLEHWAQTVLSAEEACLVIDSDEVIAAASASWSRLLCLGRPAEVAGRHLLDAELLSLIDFTAAGNELSESERDQIPPLLALSSGRLARGLLRVRSHDGIRTLDAIATPLRQHGQVIGSLSFFAGV